MIISCFVPVGQKTLRNIFYSFSALIPRSRLIFFITTLTLWKPLIVENIMFSFFKKKNKISAKTTLTYKIPIKKFNHIYMYENRYLSPYNLWELSLICQFIIFLSTVKFLSNQSLKTCSHFQCHFDGGGGGGVVFLGNKI